MIFTGNVLNGGLIANRDLATVRNYLNFGFNFFEVTNQVFGA